MARIPAVAGGGEPITHANKDAVPSNRAFGESGVADAVSAAPGGDWEGTVPHCIEKTKKGWPCTAPRAKGTEYCVGHLRKLGLLEQYKDR